MNIKLSGLAEPAEETTYSRAVFSSYFMKARGRVSEKKEGEKRVRKVKDHGPRGR